MAPPVPCRAVGRQETHRPCGLRLPALRVQHLSKSSDASSHLCLPRGPAWPPPPSPLHSRQGWRRRAAQEPHGRLRVGGWGWSGTQPAAPGASGFHFLVSMLLVSGAVVGVELVYVHPRPGDGVAGHTYTVSARAVPVWAPRLSALKPGSLRTGRVPSAPAARCGAAVPSPGRALHRCGRLSPRKGGAAIWVSISQGGD